MTKYLAIIHPATPDNTGRDTASYTVAKPPQVKWVTARSIKAAVDTVRVEPGGYVFVIPEAHVTRFARAKEAPLEECRADGNPLDRAVAA